MGDSNSVAENAGPVAYALLLRARSAAGCDAELNLLLLLTADSQPHDDAVRYQASKALEACPGDPTPGWLLAQFQSQRALVSPQGILASVSGEAVGEEPPADRVQRASLTLTRLERSFPGSADVWTAEGDMRLRLAKEYLPGQPFSSRRAYEVALAAYDRAERLGSGLPAAVGRARALVGLGRPSEAADLLADPNRRPTFRGPVLNLRIEALEEAHRFAEARQAAEELITVGAMGYPTIGPVFPGEEALSTGVDTTVPLRVSLAPEEGGAGGGDADDISFIPAFRSKPGLTGSLAHCPEWSRRRDAILAGQARDMLAAPHLTTFPDARGTDGACWMADPSLLATITRREARDRTLNIDQDDLSAIDDARQNLWRWAGDFDRAIAVIGEWDTATDRRLFLPAFRLAKIQFLQRRFDDSAATFGLAERRAESGHFITLDSARARLGRGAALVASERVEEGTAVLNGLDNDSAEVEAQFRLGRFVEQSDEVAFYYAVVSYHTRLQLGDAERRTGRYRAAAEHYAAARERMPLTFYQEEVVPGVLDNNAALADLALGRAAEAQAASTRALNEDPASPIFALTAASAAEQVGDTTRAMELNAAVLRSDPTAFPSGQQSRRRTCAAASGREGSGNAAAGRGRP